MRVFHLIIHFEKGDINYRRCIYEGQDNIEFNDHNWNRWKHIFLLRRKGDLKDWFLIYVIKTLVSTLLDGPVIKTKYLQYPHRYFPKLFDSNIVFLYILFPLSCVMYNQFTYKMKPLKTILSVFLFSGPMTVFENWLEKNTNLVKYNKGWNGYITFVVVLSFTFLLVKGCIEGIRFLDKKIHNPSVATERNELAI